jgi:hypothetical protein
MDIEKKFRYKFKRSSLQFPKEFIEFLNEQIKDGQPKNHFIMDKCGFKNYKDMGERFK